MNTPPLKLFFTLKSDTTFGRGDGAPGEVDVETQHNELGLPFYAGRSLKGVLAMECADILFALKQVRGDRWWTAGAMLFGESGSLGEKTGALIVGDAHLPDELIDAIRYATDPACPAKDRLTPRQILTSLTTTRTQTANNIETGAPLDESLRTMRVVLRETTFCSLLQFRSKVEDDELGLLAACVAGLRRLGTGRNRGRGEVRAWLADEQETPITAHFDRFASEVTKS